MFKLEDDSFMNAQNNMKLVVRFLTVFFLLAIINIGTTDAQDRLELGGFVGTSYYMGDFNPSTPFLEPHFAFGGLARYAFTDRIALKGMALYGDISGSYNGQKVNYIEDFTYGDAAFSRSVGDVTAMVEFNFRSYDHKFISSSTFTPYIAAGLGTTFYNRIDPTDGNTEAKPSFILSLPFGIGAKYKINKWIRVGAEWTLRKTFVDNLDYVGEERVDPSDPYGFDKSTFTHNNDWISYAGVYVTISMLKRKTRCNDGIK